MSELVRVIEMLTRNGRFRSALDLVLPLLDRNPHDEEALGLARAIVYFAQSPLYAYDAAEPITDDYYFDPRLDPIFCTCDVCGNSWIPSPLHSLPNVTVSNPTGLYCPKCKKIFCRDCLSKGIDPMDVYVYSCPQCDGKLSTIAKPNGRKSIQTKRRKQQIDLVCVFREGPIPPDSDYVRKILRDLSPDVFEDRPDIVALPIFPWSNDTIRQNVIMESAVRGIFPAPHLTDFYSIYQKDEGVRLCIVKIYRP